MNNDNLTPEQNTSPADRQSGSQTEQPYVPERPCAAPSDSGEQYPQPVYAPRPVYVVDPDVAALTGTAFSKGLAAAIMCQFPVASVIAIFYGSKAMNAVVTARDVAARRGVRAPKKLIAAKILGTVGKFAGIGYTVFWAVYLTYLIGWLLIMIIGVLGRLR